jgi:hypothetical protein
MTDKEKFWNGIDSNERQMERNLSHRGLVIRCSLCNERVQTWAGKIIPGCDCKNESYRSSFLRYDFISLP